MKKYIALFILALMAFPFLPLTPYWFTMTNNIGLAALVALGLVLLTGVGGMTSFGQAAFCGISAYITAFFSVKMGVSPWLTLFLSLFVTAACAYLLGLITMRLSGHYLPLGTIAWGISLYYLFGKLEMLGRHDGISGIPSLFVGSLNFSQPALAHYLIWACVLLSVLCAHRLLDSRVGRALRSLRGGKQAAESFGISVPQMKLLVFVFAAILAGLSGWLYAHTQRAINPTPFGLNQGIEYLFMAVLGGAGHIWGAVLGAGIVTLLKDVLQRVAPLLFGNEVQIEPVIFGLMLVLLLQFSREGLWAYIKNLFPSPPHVFVPSQPLSPVIRPQNAGALLRVEKMRKQFGGLVAVNDVSFEVERGQVVALIGPNGAGKSTSFNLITGLLKQTSGHTVFNGVTMKNATPQLSAQLGLGRSFQHVQLLPNMSLLENVALGAHLRGQAGAFAAIFRKNKQEEAKIFQEAKQQIERVGLGEHMHKPAGSLALGQQRIAEIARALCLNPSLLLLDEPAAGLRHNEKQQLVTLLKTLRSEGLSILVVEHDMKFVMGLADKIVVLDFGTKIAEGSPQEIKTNPAVLEAYLGGVQ